MHTEGESHINGSSSRFSSPYNNSVSEVRAFAGVLGACQWPPRSYSCSFCSRQFRSAQGLGGHMNVHRRERARLKVLEYDQLHDIPADSNQDQCPFDQVSFLASNRNPSYLDQPYTTYSRPKFSGVSSLRSPRKESCQEMMFFPSFSSSMIQYITRNPINVSTENLSPSLKNNIHHQPLDPKPKVLKKKKVLELESKDKIDLVSLDYMFDKTSSGERGLKKDYKRRKLDESSSSSCFLSGSGAFDKDPIKGEVRKDFKINSSAEDIDLELRLGFICKIYDMNFTQPPIVRTKSEVPELVITLSIGRLSRF